MHNSQCIINKEIINYSLENLELLENLEILELLEKE